MLDFRLDHVAIAVRAIDPALNLFEKALGSDFIAGGDSPSWRWHQRTLPGGGKIELLEPLGEGFLSDFLDKRGEGLHHITLMTKDISAAIAHIQGCGYELVDVHLDHPHWKEAFFRPKQAHGTLIQLAQSSVYEDEA